MIRFTKMHGIGNDYIHVNGFTEVVEDAPKLAIAMADRHRGVGSDGLILILPPEAGVEADLRMRIFNADGSEAEMCGNGIRCVCKYAFEHGLCDADPMRIQTGSGVLTLEYERNHHGLVQLVTVDMGEPKLKGREIPVKDGGEETIIDQLMEVGDFNDKMTCVSMGNPHAVFFVQDIGGVELDKLGPALEHHTLFPNRMNVHFVQGQSPTEVIMRTWERGSGITQACGTGACAVCVAGVISGRTNRKLLAHLPGGDLELNYDEKTDHVFMTGTATEVFSGEWEEAAMSHES